VFEDVGAGFRPLFVAYFEWEDDSCACVPGVAPFYSYAGICAANLFE